MKKTKTIEVEVCDNCGIEKQSNFVGLSHDVTCGICKRICCDGCTEMLHLHLDRWTPGVFGSMRSWSQNRISTKLNARFCPDCSVSIIKLLRQCGLYVGNGEV